MADARRGLDFGVIYRIIRAVSRAYFYVAFAGYVLAFVVAFAFMFIPIVTIVILLLSLYSLVFVAGAGQAIGSIERWMARGYLRRGECPRCRERIVGGESIPAFMCGGCGTGFGTDGEEVEVNQDQELLMNESTVQAV